MIGSVEPVFRFLTCRTVLCRGLRKAWQKNQCFISISTLLDFVHELTHVNEFVSTDFVILIQEDVFDVTFSHFKVTGTLSQSTIKSTYLATQTFT